MEWCFSYWSSLWYASLIDGKILVLQNAALLVGANHEGLNLESARTFLQSLQDSNGSLSYPATKVGGMGAVLYLNNPQQLQSIVDTAANHTIAFASANGTTLADKYVKNYTTADLFIGNGSALALGVRWDNAGASRHSIKTLCKVLNMWTWSVLLIIL